MAEPRPFPNDAPAGVIGQGPHGPIPSVAVSLTPDQLEAEVTRSKMGAVTFQGMVDVEQAMIVTSDVTMNAYANSGWPTLITPQTFEITGSGSEEFQVTVIVPQRTSCIMTGVVFVTATMKGPGMTPVEGEGSALVTVSQYYSMILEASAKTMEAGRGDEANFEISIVNTGNGRASFWVRVDRPEWVAASLSQQMVELGSEERANLTIRLGVGRDAPSGTHTVNVAIDVRSQEDDFMISESVPLYVRVPSLAQDMGPYWTGIIILTVVLAGGLVFYLRRSGRMRLHLVRAGEVQDADPGSE